MSHSVYRAGVALAFCLGLGVIALTGCSAERPLPLPTSAESPTSSASPTESAAPENVGTPIGLSCNELVSPQAMYDYNPNFGLNDSYVPAAGGAAARILDFNGLACSWVNQTSGETIAVSVANLPAATLSKIKGDLTASSKPVTDFGGSGYFTVASGAGAADALSGPFWVDASSTAFGEAADAQPIVAAALDGLGQ
jgi:hypothetical protein